VSGQLTLLPTTAPELRRETLPLELIDGFANAAPSANLRELIRDLGPPFADAWRSLVDAHGPKQAARIFAKVLGHVETRGADTVATTLADALSRSEPLLLALAPPPAPCASVADDALPASLRAVDVAAGSAADYDALLRAGGDS